MKLKASSDGVKMSVLPKQSIWDFATDWYSGEGIEVDCLEAQEKYSMDVTAIIIALYRARHGEGVDAGMAVELARTMSARVIEPLRRCRIALKTLPRLVSVEAANALRARVKTAEWEAEKLTLEALALLPVIDVSLSGEQGLIEIANASQADLNADLGALLKRLALRAQNM
jgi:uncharacterized protein (TIGR02444 family)